jgi:virulence-associated protein E
MDQAGSFEAANKNTVTDAICVVAERNAFHPVRDYLDSLKWDGKPRLGRLFQHYFNAKVPDEQADFDRLVAYLEHISICWASCAARVFKPGCKVDHTPVFSVAPRGSTSPRQSQPYAVTKRGSRTTSRLTSPHATPRKAYTASGWPLHAP